MVVPKLREGSSILVLFKGLYISWSFTGVTVFHSSILDDTINQAKLFQLNGGALSGELDAKEGRDISAFNFQIHLPFVLHPVNQRIKSSPIYTKPEVIVNVGKADCFLVDKETKVHIFVLLEACSFEACL